MIIDFDRDTLLSAIGIVSRAVPSRTSMPILNCFLIRAAGGQIILDSNDNEMAIETAVSEKCEVKEEGSAAVDARLFTEIIRKIDADEDIHIEADGSIVRISSLYSEFKVQEMDADQFPVLSVLPEDQKITLSQFTLKEIIRSTIFSISPNDSNKMMSGAYFEVNGNELKSTTLDGHRISIRKTELRQEYGSYKAIIPGKTLNEISRIIADDAEKDVDIIFDRDTVMFRFDGTVITSRLIEGEYFRTEYMISDDYDTKLTVNRNRFLEHLERAVILFRETDKRPLVINIRDNDMNLRLNAAFASLNAHLSVDKQGNDLMIGFNPRFLAEVMRVLSDEKVTLYMTNPKAPCYIRDDENTYIYIVLPINFNPGAYL